ncbi:MAG: hypothetical protein ACUZ9M_03610 [Candidatus Scalindua sp.]
MSRLCDTKKFSNLCETMGSITLYRNKTGAWMIYRNLIVMFFVIALTYQLALCPHVSAKDLPPKTVSLSSITILKELSKDNEFFTIGDPVRVDDKSYRFLIKSPHGDYDVVSIKDLLKVCYEIRIIEEYRATEHGGQAWDSAGESLKGIGRGAKQIVKNPKESAKAFGRAGGKLLRGVGRFFKKHLDKDEEKVEENTEQGEDRSKGGKGFATGKHARQFAAELGLDVYSDNPYVQVLIREIAKERAKGSIGTSVGLFFLAPVQGLGVLSNSLTPDGSDAEIEELITTESPPELKYVLSKKYKEELNFEYKKKSELKKFLDNPNYTPREQAYLYHYLRQLGKPEEGSGVDGLEDVIKHLGKVRKPDEATFALNQMELLSAYQKYAGDLETLVSVSNILGAVKEGKQMFFIVPYDIVGNTADMKKLLNKIADAKKEYGAKKVKLWVTGNTTSGFVSEAKSRGIKVKGNVLQFPYFTHKETPKQEK